MLVLLTFKYAYANINYMANDQITHHNKRSKLDAFKLDFEYNRSLREERKLTRQRRGE
jgi:hypothetical protein